MRKQVHNLQTEQLPKQQAIEVLKELQEVSCYLNDGKFPGDVLPVLKDGASSSERFTSETENVFRGIDITVV